MVITEGREEGGGDEGRRSVIWNEEKGSKSREEEFACRGKSREKFGE